MHTYSKLHKYGQSIELLCIHSKGYTCDNKAFCLIMLFVKAECTSSILLYPGHIISTRNGSWNWKTIFSTFNNSVRHMLALVYMRCQYNNMKKNKFYVYHLHV